MTPKLRPELQDLLQRVNKHVDHIRQHLNTECTNLAEAWAANLAEYLYASAEAVEALQRDDKTAAAKHRLDATCYRARADRKHKNLRRAIESFPDDEPST